MRGTLACAVLGLLLSQVACKDKSSSPDDEPEPGLFGPGGEWVLDWEGMGRRTFSYALTFAPLNADGSVALFFMSSLASAYPLASASVPDFSSLQEGDNRECGLMISFGPELSDLLVAPFDPLVVEVVFTHKDVGPGGTLSGSFEGDLSTSEYPDLAKVTIVSAEFEHVPIKGSQ